MSFASGCLEFINWVKFVPEAYIQLLHIAWPRLRSTLGYGSILFSKIGRSFCHDFQGFEGSRMISLWTSVPVEIFFPQVYLFTALVDCCTRLKSILFQSEVPNIGQRKSVTTGHNDERIHDLVIFTTYSTSDRQVAGRLALKSLSTGLQISEQKSNVSNRLLPISLDRT